MYPHREGCGTVPTERVPGEVSAPICTRHLSPGFPARNPVSRRFLRFCSSSRLPLRANPLDRAGCGKQSPLNGIQDENCIPDLHVNVAVGGGGPLAGAAHGHHPCWALRPLPQSPRARLHRSAKADAPLGRAQPFCPWSRASGCRSRSGRQPLAFPVWVKRVTQFCLIRSFSW